MLSIEESQAVIDLRQRMLENVEQGREPHYGMDPEEYRKCLDIVRGGRARLLAAEDAKPKRAKKAAKAAPPQLEPGKSVLDNPKFAKFKNFNLD